LSNASSVETSAGPLSDVRSMSLSEEPARKSRVRELWAAWKRVARKIGDFQARVLLTLFYFVLLAPFALLVRRTSDPLSLKAGAQRGWGVRDNTPDEYTLEMARKQF
jgi:hypothetical protein